MQMYRPMSSSSMRLPTGRHTRCSCVTTRAFLKDPVPPPAPASPVPPQPLPVPFPPASSVKKGPQAIIAASKDGVQTLMERERPLSEYMALPASQYSVLDARRVERLGEDTFRCYVGQLRILTLVVEPVITLSVTVDGGEGCTIRLLSCELDGSDFIKSVNDKFTAQMTNVVRYRDDVEGPVGTKAIVSNTSIRVVVDVPGWCSWIPAGSIGSAASSVLQKVLDLSVPRFLLQLSKDYERWALGDESRKPMGDIMEDMV